MTLFQQFQLRAGELGAIGMVTPKYLNLPFQSWDMKCDLEKSDVITLTVNAAIVTAVFNFQVIDQARVKILTFF